jgi:UDP-N-acetylmuramyl pentapeptide phosphotransferase/UDP-N-acetylglucosamine-1-phosphate transferase
MKPSIFEMIIVLISSFLLSYVLYPKIISVVSFKKLMEKPNDRSSHSTATPSLGGIAFFIVLILSFYFLEPFDKYNTIPSLIPGLTILFIVGLKDDLVVISPVTKLGAEILAATFLVLHPSFEIESLHGFFGFFEVSKSFTVPLSIFIVIVIINAFNLIDGIDGLAATIGTVIFGTFGTIFYMTQSYLLLGVCLVMIGCLTAFLRFNVSHSKKIFMGDTGSLIVGLIIGMLVLRFLALTDEKITLLPFKTDNYPYIVLAILIVPFFDTARVFTIRIMNKRGPFSPDRNHIHHILIDFLHLSHIKASIFLGIFNLIFISIFLTLSIFLNQKVLFLCSLIAVLSLVYFFFVINKNTNAIKAKSKIKKQFKKKLSNY